MTPEQLSGEWRRLPVSAVAALYISGVQKAVRENLFLFFGAGTGAILTDSFGLREAGLVAATLLLIGLLVALVYHRKFRFLVHHDSVRVRRGLFEQKELKVRFERIQNVAFSQPLYLKPLDLVRVRLETPGAAQTEVELPGIPVRDAVALRQRIAGLRSSAESVQAADVTAADSAGSISKKADVAALFAPGFGGLFRYGMTSNQLWIVLAVIAGPLAERTADRVGDVVDRLEAVELIDVGALAAAPMLAAALLIGAIAVLIALGLLLSGVIAVLRFHGYRLSSDDGRLRAEYGLLERHEKTLKRSKLHSLEIVQTALGRLLGRWHVVGHQAALDAMNPLNKDKRFLVPGIPAAELSPVVAGLSGRSWLVTEFRAIDRRFRRVLWQRMVAIPLALLMAGQLLAPQVSVWLLPGLIGLALLVASLIHLRWKRWGIAFGAEFVQVRNGLFGSRIVLFEDARCQQLTVKQSPYQRRHGLATLVIRLPHGETTVPYLPEPLAAELANRLLYRVETSHSHAL